MSWADAVKKEYYAYAIERMEYGKSGTHTKQYEELKKYALETKKAREEWNRSTQ